MIRIRRSWGIKRQCGSYDNGQRRQNPNFIEICQKDGSILLDASGKEVSFVYMISSDDISLYQYVLHIVYCSWAARLWFWSYHKSTSDGQELAPWPVLTLIPAWISNHMPSGVLGEITYPFPNFNVYTVEVWEWINNFIPPFIMDVITSPF